MAEAKETRHSCRALSPRRLHDSSVVPPYGQVSFDVLANGPLGQRSLPFAYTSSAAAGDVRELVVDETQHQGLGGFVVESLDGLD